MSFEFKDPNSIETQGDPVRTRYSRRAGGLSFHQVERKRMRCTAEGMSELMKAWPLPEFKMAARNFHSCCGGGGRAEVFEMLFRKEGRKEPQARSPGCVARGLQSSGEPAAAPTARLTHSASPCEDPTRASFPPEAGRSLGRETRRALHARSSQCDRVLERQS